MYLVSVCLERSYKYKFSGFAASSQHFVSLTNTGTFAIKWDGRICDWSQVKTYLWWTLNKGGKMMRNSPKWRHPQAGIYCCRSQGHCFNTCKRIQLDVQSIWKLASLTGFHQHAYPHIHYYFPEKNMIKEIIFWDIFLTPHPGHTQWDPNATDIHKPLILITSFSPPGISFPWWWGSATPSLPIYV